jgi:ribokinase
VTGRIVNFGSLCIDSVLPVPRFVVPGETLRAAGVERLAGGKGLNQSLAAARAGAPVRHVGRVGADGDELVGLLAAAGVDVSAVERCPELPTGHAFVQVAPDGENAIVIVPGANRGMPEAFLDTVVAGLGAGDWLLLQNETDWVPEAIARAGASPARVALNLAPADASARDWPLEQVDLFVLNETEARVLTGADTPKAQCAVLAARAPGALVALTLGAGGSVLAAGPRADGPHTPVRVPAFAVEVVDATGAGDAFTGCLVASLLLGRAPGEAVLRANAAGALACTRRGAAPAMPEAAAIEALLAGLTGA